jgi:hypothetical protein
MSDEEEQKLICYVCREPFKDHDLVIPLIAGIKAPFGHFHVTILQHFLCGLNHYLDSMMEAPNIASVDKTAIEAKLMEILSKMSEGTKQ